LKMQHKMLLDASAGGSIKTKRMKRSKNWSSKCSKMNTTQTTIEELSKLECSR
jgi:hypothetical protein